MSARVSGSLALALALVAGGLAGCLADGDGAAGASAPFAVRIEGPASAGVGEVATFLGRAEGVPDGTAFWFWDFGDGVEHENVDLDHVEHEFSEAGGFVVTLTIVDAEGRRAVGTHAISVNQEFSFEGTVAAPTALGVGEESWSSAFPAGENATSLVVEARFTNAGLVPAAEGVGDGAAPRVTVRLLAPENENGTAGRSGDPLLLELSLDVGPDGERLRAVVAGDRFFSPADLRLEIVPESGTTHFEATCRVSYG